MTEPLWSADAVELAGFVRAGEVKAVELLDLCLERIGRYDGVLNAFVTLDPASARMQAEAVDGQVAAGVDPGPLAGVPLGVKDLENATGLPTGRGSLLFQDAVADHDSTQLGRLRRAGAVVVGKTAAPELGSLSFTWSKAHGTTRNPWNAERTPGGSSGGSAAAVAAGLIPLATGSDGAGSLRIPASFSGLAGIKPSFGRIPRGPGRLGAANVSTPGPLARSVRDLACYLEVASGPHPSDPFSLPVAAERFEEGLVADQGRPLRAAWSSTLGLAPCDPDVAGVARFAAERVMEAAGIEEAEVAIELPDAADSWVVAVSLDCYAELEQFWPARADAMTPVIVLALQLAESLTADQIGSALRGRDDLLRAVNEVFESVDLILSPATTTPAFGAEGPLPDTVAGTILAHPLVSIGLTYPFNLTGHPALSLPAGLTADGLPVGLQMIGPRLGEARLLSAAAAFEAAAPWPKVAPDYR